MEIAVYEYLPTLFAFKLGRLCYSCSSGVCNMLPTLLKLYFAKIGGTKEIDTRIDSNYCKFLDTVAVDS